VALVKTTKAERPKENAQKPNLKRNKWAQAEITKNTHKNIQKPQPTTIN